MALKKGDSHKPESFVCAETVTQLEMKLDSLERLFEERFENLTDKMTQQFDGCRQVCILKLDTLKSRADSNQTRIKEHDEVIAVLTEKEVGLFTFEDLGSETHSQSA